MTGVNVLALDTATNHLSLALMRDTSVLVEVGCEVKTGHAGLILQVIDEVLSKGGIKPEEIGLIAAGTGPGSFTGLRIGIATAKGLASAVGCPLAGVPTLDTIAQGALPRDMQVMPILDAKKGEIFCALYAADGSMLTGYMNLRPEGIAAVVREDTLFIGNGCALYRDVLSRVLGEHYHEGPVDLWHPKASVLAGIALKGPFDALHDEVQPLYVRASDATLLLERTRKATPDRTVLLPEEGDL